MTSHSDRYNKFRWIGWFALLNSALLAVIGLRYFAGFSSGGTWLSWIYLLLIYCGHHILLTVLPLYVLMLPLVLLNLGRRLITAIGILIIAVMISLILLDSLLWAESRFHLNALTARILGWQSWVFVAFMFVLAVIFESMLATRSWKWVDDRPRRAGWWVALACTLTVLGGQFIYVWADASYYVPVTSVGQQLPVYKGFTAKKRMVDWGLVDPQKSRDRQMARRLARQLEQSAAGVLDYPTRELQCVGERRLNVVLILSDALRSDLLNPTDMPLLSKRAAAGGQLFSEHFSGGNSSRMGLFSLFYGLPPGYWSTFESLQRPALLIDEFQRQEFQLGLFASSTMYRPAQLDRTAFAGVADLRLESEPRDAPSWQRDEVVNVDWWRWLDERDNGEPFFGFLFFNSTNAMSYPNDYSFPSGFEDEGLTGLDLEFVQYRRASYYTDDLIEQIMVDLEERELLESTIIIVSSDHGEEFDESGAGLTKHGSGYTRYQLQVPMVVFWPGRPPAVHRHRTSHYDFVPTLMEDVLGCPNDPADYSSGRNLFSGESWDWLLAASYYNYAVVEPDQLTITYPNGSYEVREWNYRMHPDPQIRGDVLQAVTRENSRFYR